MITVELWANEQKNVNQKTATAIFANLYKSCVSIYRMWMMQKSVVSVSEHNDHFIFKPRQN